MRGSEARFKDEAVPRPGFEMLEHDDEFVAGKAEPVIRRLHGTAQAHAESLEHRREVNDANRLSHFTAST